MGALLLVVPSVDGDEVYELAGSSFKKVELPDLRYPADAWPKGPSRKSGGEYIYTRRWLDANTLLLERQSADRHGPNIEKTWRLTAEITLVLDKEGRPAVKKIRKIEGKNQ